MYGFCTQFDWEIFLDREVESVAFAAHTVVLNFAGRLSVTILGNLEVEDARFTVDEPIAGALVRCIGKTVTSVIKPNSRELVLTLQDTRIRLFDDSDAYEALIIDSPIGKYVV